MLKGDEILKYKRVLLKFSGEALATESGSGIDFEKALTFAREIKECSDAGVEIAIVVGGGNFWRGKLNTYMDRATSDYIGMLATTMNALALGDAFKQIGADVRVQTGIEMRQVAEFYIKDRAIRPDALIKATNVDGIYDKDPKKFEDAEFIPHTTYLDVLNKQLKVMDSTAISLCMEEEIPILVFNIHQPGNLHKLLLGEEIGSVVS